MSLAIKDETKLTKPQSDALEWIRNTKVVAFPDGIRGGRDRMDFNEGMIRRLEAKGLVIVEVFDQRVDRRVRITDAGRRALGDWAAGMDIVEEAKS
jgi:hypothetical protein